MVRRQSSRAASRHQLEQLAAGSAAAALAAGPAPLVPSRRQYLDLKAQHPEAILLYRLGDFYETFDEDARTIARDARVTLTSRSFGRSGRVPMAGIPHHALNHYLGRLLAAGHTVAIAEQLTPAGKGLVERGVTRVITPGTIADPALLPAGENRYLAAIARAGDRVGLAWVDVSTGEFAVMQLAGDDAALRLGEEIARVDPVETLVADLPDEPSITAGGHQTRLERWLFDPERARMALCRCFGVPSLAAYGCDDLPQALGAAGAVLAYLGRTNPALLPLLTGLRTETPSDRVGLDAATRRNLELTRSHRTGGSRGSLLGVLDQTRTAMGARALRRLLGRPLRDRDVLLRRQAIVGAMVEAPALHAAIGDALAAAGDLERLTGRIIQGQPTPRDLVALGVALAAVPEVIVTLREASNPALAAFAAGIDPCADLRSLAEAAADEDEEGVARVRPGFCAELDAAVAGAGETRRWLATLERGERERTGIRSLKVGYNKVFGYYIEVTRPNLSLVPAEYTRKQTVATGERYVTAPLKEAEARLLAADETIAELTKAALSRAAAGIAAGAARLSATAGALADLDALASLAAVAARGRWVAPDLDDGDTLTIEGGRHPVVEESLASGSGESFVANDCRLGDGRTDPRIVIVTGPNMGGKSTFLRQVAVIVLLAQIGSYVPAERARIGLVDRIFTRIGAHDDLAGGRSTFMIEMVETAAILHQATRRSLVIVDELGRGTGTADGLAIAQAVLEDLHGRVRARALLATHYLELTALADELPGVANAHVAALESDEGVVFLYAMRPGAAGRAYGVQVARLAGLPPWVVARAETLLDDESDLSNPRRSVDHTDDPSSSPRSLDCRDHLQPPDRPPAKVAEPTARSYDSSSAPSPIAPLNEPLAATPTPIDPAIERLAAALRGLDLANTTPRQALDWLFDQRDRLLDDDAAGV